MPAAGRRGLLRPALLALIPAILVALLVQRTFDSPQPSPTAAVGRIQGTGLTTWPKGLRPPSPQIRGRTLEDAPLDLAQFRGKVVVVNVWGSWCAPCRQEAPELVRVAAETAAAGVRFVGIDVRDNRAAARAFVRRYGLGYPSLFDPDGRLLLAFRGTVPTQAVPSTVVIDADGAIAARVIGRVEYRTLRGLLDDLMAERTAAADRAVR